MFNSDGAFQPGFANITRRTRTDGIMVDHLANCIDTTSVNTRVSTFLVEAGFIPRTVLVDYTFWVNTAGNAIDNTALTVAAARRWDARVLRWS